MTTTASAREDHGTEGRLRQVERWGMVEMAVPAASGNSEQGDTGVSLVKAIFSNGNRKREVAAFTGSNGEQIVRFMPGEEGEWTYSIWQGQQNGAGQAGSDLQQIQVGSFICTPPSAGNRGPVQVVGKAAFAYADGTPYVPIGTTSLEWYKGEQAEATLASLQDASFTKLRMRVDAAGLDQLEAAIIRLSALGIEAELLLDCSEGGPEAAQLVRETVSRLAAYRNVWWTLLLNEAGTPAKERAELLRLIQAHDAYGHLLTIHTANPFADFSVPAISHVSLICTDASQVSRYAELHGKPVILDQCGSEGDAPTRIGSLPAEELVNRIWISMCRGGFAGHGETFVREHGETWQTQGGALSGESAPRIAFLRSIMEGAPTHLRYMPEYYDAPTIGVDGEYYLQYHIIHRFPYKQLRVPEGRYKVELIDVWNMTVTELPGEFTDNISVPLPSKRYQALRIRNQAAAAQSVRYDLNADQPSKFASKAAASGTSRKGAAGNRLEADDNFIRASERPKADHGEPD
ncbi:DUF5605 domain-containing protein [Paenibacillus sp. y28]